jgi:hypothetical protein
MAISLEDWEQRILNEISEIKVYVKAKWCALLRKYLKNSVYYKNSRKPTTAKL